MDGAAVEAHLLVLRVPIGGYGKVWPALNLRRPWPGTGPEAQAVEAVARSAGVPLAAAYDLAPDDLAAALAWVRGGAGVPSAPPGDPS